MVRACDETRVTLRRKEGDGNESKGRRKRGRPKGRWLDKVHNIYIVREETSIFAPQRLPF